RCRDRKGGGLLHLRHFRALRRAGLSRRRAPRHRTPAARSRAGAGDRRRRVHGPRHARPDPRYRHLGAAAGPPAVRASQHGTRAQIRDTAISVWLRADLQLLLSRTTRRANRPLLRNGARKDTLKRLVAERHPVYAEADIVVDSAREAPDATVDRVLKALSAF